jgi:hypothetical protein
VRYCPVTESPVRHNWAQRLKAAVCVLAGALMLMATAFAGGRPSVFFDTDGYYLMGENLAQVIKTAPQVFMGHVAVLHTPVSDDDQIDVTIMGARSPVYGLFLFVFEKLGGVWLVAGVQALICAWMLYLLWRAVAPGRPLWTYLALMAGLTVGSTLPFFTTFVMPDVFAGVACVGFVVLTLFGDRLTRAEKAAVFVLMAFAFAVHTTHYLTLLAALVPAGLVLWWFKAPRAQVLKGMGLSLAAVAVAILSAKAYAWAFAGRNGHELHRPPFLMARVLADGPGRDYLRRVCVGPDKPYVVCRFVSTPLTRSDDILWEESPLLGAFNALKSPDLQLKMEAEEMTVVKGAVMADPLGQLQASLGNWVDQFFRISSHDPLRDPRQFLANEYWKTTRLVDLIPNPRQCKPIGPGCKPPFDMSLTKHWHELVIALCILFAGWRLSRPDVVADLKDRAAPWRRPSTPVIAAGIILLGMVVLNAGICGVLSGAFSRYQARIVWLVPASAAIIALRLGLAVPGRFWPARLRRLSGRPVSGAV